MESYVAHCTNGIWAKDATQWVDKRLDEMPYAQAGIQRINNAYWLVSYVTHVARVTKDGWLYVGGLYSATTRKHIGAFLKEMKRFFAFRPDLATYQTAKRCFEQGVEVNLWSGDERKVTEQ